MSRKATWAAVAGAIVFVIVVAIAMRRFWDQLGASEISPAGWVALILGIVFAVALWAGLTAAMIISNRKGWDERPEQRREFDPK